MPDNLHIFLLASQVANCILVLDDGALGLRNCAVPQVVLLNAEWLAHCVIPIEVDQSDHVKVLIELLKSTLEPGNLG